jgi:DNA-binding transcriptional ArsR family regulator
MTELEQLQASAEQAATLLKAMSNPRRLLILCTLCGAPGTSAGAGPRDGPESFRHVAASGAHA